MGNEERAAAAADGDGGDDELAREAREMGASRANIDQATRRAMAGNGRNGLGHVTVARRPARDLLARRGKAHVLNLRDNAG